MLEAAEQAVTFGQDQTSETLGNDRMRALAIVRCIEIIGEAASKVTEDTRRQFSEVPWGDIVGMRNRLIHAYFDVDLDRVCDTVTADLPPLILKLREILQTA
jgi:uncharacterized protein with HEPN domain